MPVNKVGGVPEGWKTPKPQPKATPSQRKMNKLAAKSGIAPAVSKAPIYSRTKGRLREAVGRTKVTKEYREALTGDLQKLKGQVLKDHKALQSKFEKQKTSRFAKTHRLKKGDLPFGPRKGQLRRKAEALGRKLGLLEELDVKEYRQALVAGIVSNDSPRAALKEAEGQLLARETTLIEEKVSPEETKTLKGQIKVLNAEIKNIEKSKAYKTEVKRDEMAEVLSRVTAQLEAIGKAGTFNAVESALRSDAAASAPGKLKGRAKKRMGKLSGAVKKAQAVTEKTFAHMSKINRTARLKKAKADFTKKRFIFFTSPKSGLAKVVLSKLEREEVADRSLTYWNSKVPKLEASLAKQEEGSLAHFFYENLLKDANDQREGFEKELKTLRSDIERDRTKAAGG